MLRRWTWISSLLLVGAGLLWLRGLWARDRLALDGPEYIVRFENFPHHLVVGIARRPPALEPGIRVNSGADTISAQPQFWEVRYRRFGNGAIMLGIPYWLVVMLSIALPIWAAYCWWHQRRRHREGLCVVCGYDLRASTDRCPECGEPISTSTPATSAS